MNIIIFVDDIGTLRTERRELKDTTKKYLEVFMKMGIHIVLTTGLPRYICSKVSEECRLSKYIISSNGAEIYDLENNRILYNCKIDSESISNFYKAIEEEKFNVLIGFGSYEVSNYLEDDNGIKKMNSEQIKNEIKKGVYQCRVSQRALDIESSNWKQITEDEFSNFLSEYGRDLVWEILGSLDKTALYDLCDLNYDNIWRRVDGYKVASDVIEYIRFHKLKKLKNLVENKIFSEICIGNQSVNFDEYGKDKSQDNWFSVVHKEASKGIAALNLCHYLKIDSKYSVGLGNDFNDIKLFKSVGLPICINNPMMEEKNLKIIHNKCIDDALFWILQKIEVGELSIN